VPLDNLVFWVFAPISIASAIAMLVMRNAVHSALFLVVNFFTIAVMYLLLDAPFLFAVQIIVYAGAIMVLFLFVIMLLGVDRGDDRREPLMGQRALAVVLGVGFVLEIGLAVRAAIGFSTLAPDGFDEVNRIGNAEALAEVLFRDYFFPFEVTSILLIVAAIAAMVLAQRKAPAITQAEAAGRPAGSIHARDVPEGGVEGGPHLDSGALR
jgi:NADH-quinone oxidoreductase subunit J